MKKNRKRTGGLILSLAAFLLCAIMALPQTVFAGAGDKPDAEKSIRDNHDGTYTLSLDIVGESEVDTENTKANIVVILDRSGSMRYYVESDTGRYGSSNDSPPSQNNYYGNNRVTLYDANGNALTDDTTAGPVYTRSGNWPNYRYTEYTGKRYADELRMAVAKEAVTDLVTQMQQYNADVPNTVQMALVSFSDRASTNQTMTGNLANITNAMSSINPDGGTNWEEALQTARNIARNADSDPTYVIFVTDGNPTRYGTGQGSGQETNTNITTSYNAARDDARSIVNDGFTLYNLGVFGNVDRMENLTEYANGATSADKGAATYYSVANKEELQAAFAEIIDQISNTIGITDVDIVDGTTQTVTTESGVAHLLEVVPNSFKYYRSGGAYGNMKEWTSADDPAPPAASFNSETGKVEWDLASIGVLENNVKYTVTFDVYPSQETYDLIAQLKNGDIQYSEVDPAIQQYIDEDSYSLRTNTTASYSWTDTREETPKEHSENYVNPDPVATSSDTLPIKKEWVGGNADVNSVDITVLTDEGTDEEEVFHTATLSGPSWETSSFISVGIIKDGQPLPGAMGHDFSFAELDDTQYHWEIDAPIVRPMLINGGGAQHTPTVLIKVDSKHPAPSGAQTYTIEDSTYYVDAAMTGLTATNHRRSNLNLSKTVTGEDAPKDATFPFTLTVNNSLAPATEPTDDPEHGSDYWVWFSIYDTKAGATVTDATISGATGPNADGYYYAKSGSAISVQMKDGWNLRFTNLPSGSTYTLAEGDLAEGFAFKNAELTVGEDSTFSGGKTSTGTIENTQTSYQVAYTNDYQLTDLDITKVWKDANNQDGIRLTPDELKAKLTLSPAVQGAEPTVTDNGDGTYTITYKDLPRFNNGQEVEYTVAESAIDGYTTEGSPAKDHGTITNTHTPQLTEKVAKKVWDDKNNANNTRPASITFTLKNGNTTVATARLDGTADAAPTGTEAVGYESDSWEATFINLPKKANGQDINYTIDEPTIEGYTSTVTKNDDGSFTVKNTYNFGALDISKTVDPGNGNDTEIANKEFTFTVGLYKSSSKETALDGQFDYTITDAAGATVSTGKIASGGTVKLKGGQKVHIADIPIGTYYEVTEATESGYTTTKTGDTGTIASSTTAEAKFTNTYKADPATARIPVKKVVNAASGLNKPTITDEYTFTIADDPSDTVESPLPDNKTVKSNGDGVTVLFDSISYKKPGTYKYQITETGTVAGVTNDSVNPKSVTVVVTDNGDGTLSAVANGGAALEFDNTYSVEAIPVNIPVTKIVSVPTDWTGPSDWSYDISLSAQGGAPEAATMSGKVTKASPTITFGPINYTGPGTYKYTVTESGNVAGVTNENPASKEIVVKVTDDGKGNLSAKVNDGSDIKFTNTYDVEPTTVSFPVKKVVSVPEGVEGPAEWSYAIDVEANDGAPEAASMSGTVTKASPVTTFGPFSYEEPGTYTYTVTESGDVTGVYDDPEATTGKTVTVSVVDNGNGTLTATADSTTDSPVTFTNQYKQAVAHASVTKEYKVPVGLTGPDIAKKYTFTLTGNGDAPMPAESGRTVTNDSESGQGSWEFGDIVFNKVGTYTYTITETGEVKGVENDKDAASGKTVTIVVDEDKDGNLYVTDESVTNVTFVNTYSAEPTTASFPVKKILNVPAGLTPADITGKFTFTLTAEDGTPMPEKTSYTNPDADGGTVTFGSIKFEEEGTYVYTVTETGRVDGITNDGVASKTVTIEVVDNKDGTLTATPSSTEDDPLTFTNGYSVTTVTANIPVLKTLTKPEYDGATTPNITGKYTFKLEAGTNTAAGGIETPLPEKTELKNPAADGGAVSFGAITYSAPGTYNYTVTEAGEVPGVTNDKNNPREVQVVVTDNGDGTLDAVVNDGAQVIFTNDYEAKPGKVSFPVKKEMVVPKDLEGPATWSYDINVTAGEGSPTTDTMTGTVTNENDTVTFGDFTFDKPGTYTYTVTESGTIAGVDNDKDATTGKTVTVTVVDNGTGTLVATASSTEEEPLTFTNTYKANPTTAEIPVEKILSAAEDLTKPNITKKFTFTLVAGQNTAAEGTETPMPNVKSYQNPSADGGSVTFGGEDDPITFTKPGIYTYQITEEGTVDGVTNDGNKTIQINVTDKGDGTLQAVVNNGQPIQFNNVYQAKPAKIKIPVEKILEVPEGLDGPKTIANEFTFTLTAGANTAEGGIDTPVPAVTELKNPDADGGSVEFGDITFTKPGDYSYTVTEAGSVEGVTNDDAATDGKTVVVKVTDDGSGTLKAKLDNPEGLTFTNTYNATPTKANAEAEKTLKGRTLKDGEFTFELTAAGEGGKTYTATNDGNGKVEFEEITFDKAGDYTYTLKETKGNLKGVTYDETTHEVVFHVVDNQDGTMSATVTYDGKADVPVFKNTYESSGSVVLEALKVLNGRTLKEGQFTFQLKDAEGKVLDEQTNAADGTVTFDAVSFTEKDVDATTGEGTATFTISEVEGDAAGYTYDTNPQTITVTLKDDGEGNITATPDKTGAQVEFNNYYNAEGSAKIELNKDLKGRKLADGQFAFTITGEDTSGVVSTSAVNDADGKVVFDINYDQDDAGKTFNYTITEENAGAAGYHYAEDPIEVSVKVTDNGDGTLKTEVTYPEVKDFINTYKADGKINFVVNKTLTGRTLEEGQFTFQLKDKDGKVLEEKTNTAGGTVTFSDIKYTEADADKEFDYVISEVPGDNDAYDYDSHDVRYHVVVTDNGDGTMTATESTADSATFENTYTAEGKMILTAKKVLNGRQIAAGQFTFQLKDSTGKVVAEGTNDANGDVTFSAVTYTQDDVDKTTHEGTAAYTITEVNDQKDGYTYDSQSYDVNVSLVDDGKGHITATPDKSGAAFTFTNTYKAEGDVELKGVKNLAYGDLKDQTFDFVVLDEGGNEVATATAGGANADVTGDANTKAGTSTEFKFSKIEYAIDPDADRDDTGEHTYTIKEVIPDDAVNTKTGKTYAKSTDEEKADGIFELGDYRYDGSVQTIKVTVTDNGDGTLKAKADEAATIEFNNTKAYTDLIITKAMDSYVEHEKATEVTLAFRVVDKATKGEKFSAAGGLTFTADEVKKGDVKTLLIDKIPTDVEVEVTEVYSSNYKPDAVTKKLELGDDGIYTARFDNTYDDTIYNRGAINNYTKNDEGGYDYTGTGERTKQAQRLVKSLLAPERPGDRDRN